MTPEIVDEIVTPGCPNCAVKHLSTALAIVATLKQEPERAWDDEVNRNAPMDAEARILVSQAYINLVEAEEGYESHRTFAVGLLNLAEQASVESRRPRTETLWIRAARLTLMAGEDVTQRLRGHVSHASLWCAHQREAMRELPGFDWESMAAQYGKVPIHEYFQHCIEAIKKEYFDVPETPGKGGEGDMACAKKGKATFGKKADPKAAKAACKGGCSKKGGKK